MSPCLCCISNNDRNMASFRLSFSTLFVAFLVSFILFSFVHASDDDTKQTTTTTDDDDNDALAAEIAEEEAALAVGEDAEEEEDDDADALDEDADSARYDPERRHPLSDLPPPATDINIGYQFISGMSSTTVKTKKETETKPLITLGEPIKTILAFSNNGKSSYHIWGIMGSLNRDTKFDVHVQNFTYHVINKTIDADEELSFSYTFEPNARLDIRPFQLAVTTFYEARSSSSGNAIKGYSSTFYNETVITQPGNQTMSNGLFIGYFVVFIVGCGAAWYIWKNYDDQQQEKHTHERQKDSTGENGNASDRNEWLEDHLGLANAGGGRAKRRTTTKQ